MAETKKATKEEKMVTIRLPRLSKSDEDEFISINERTWLIKRGVEVEVPECVAKAIKDKEAMEEDAYTFELSVQK